MLLERYTHDLTSSSEQLLIYLRPARRASVGSSTPLVTVHWEGEGEPCIDGLVYTAFNFRGQRYAVGMCLFLMCAMNTLMLDVSNTHLHQRLLQVDMPN